MDTLRESEIETSKKPGRILRSAVLSFAALLAVALMMPIGAMAQLSGKGAITGTVTDKTGAVIAGATITATNTANGVTTVTKSTGAGDFIFANLDPGIYTVTTTAPGFEKLTQQNVHVNALASQAYNPVLQVGAADVQITVSAEPPQLETSNAALGATMEQETYAALPIEMGAYGQPDQRRATDFAYLMPGVQGNETNGNATTNTGVVNGSGSRGAVSDVYVDGIPFVRAGGNGDPRYVWTAISVDAVDQFQVQTTGYPAMYEGQGVMNYSIKHGGSQFHGSVYEFFRNTSLDTWGFFRALDPTTYMPVKPIEHMNEYGIAIGGPLIPLGSLKQKIFFFTNYNGFRYSSENPTPMRFPTNAERGGDFSADGVNIYDPTGQFLVSSKPYRCQFYSGGYTVSGTTCTGSGTANVIPSSYISSNAKAMNAFLPSITSTATGNNYTSPNRTGLNNWSTTSRIDYVIGSRDTMSVLNAVGRQASSNPVGQTTSGRNTGPVPYNYGQTYAPKTAVWAIEETHTFSPNLLNQVKWGYARYNGPTFNPNDNPTYSATTMGLSNLPSGQAQNVFPIVAFNNGTNACSTGSPTNCYPTLWGGTTENRTTAANYTALDSLQWNVGRHSFTFGGQVAWLLYNVINATGAGGSTPLTLGNAVTETAGLAGTYTVTGGTGLSYASFLLGEVDKGSFTQYIQYEFGARFRAISPYVQDDWKVNNKLTVNLGLRYDFYPTLTEVHNAESFYSPTLANTVTGLNGALQFTGSGAGTCNCSTPVSNYYKNWGPRLGFAYQVDPKTVVRASFGIVYSHGDAVGGLASSLGTLGFSAAPSFSSTNDQSTMTGLLHGGTGAVPSWTTASGVASGPTYGTGYTTVSGFTSSPSSMAYDDQYLGGRAPEFENWNVSLQQQVTNSVALTLAYVGSEGHFLQLDSYHARGYWADDLDPKYLYLGTRLADTGSTTTTVTADCTAYGLTCPGLSIYSKSQPLSTLLKPFPFQSVTDGLGYVGNANYNALQAMLSVRSFHGLTMNANYVWSRTIDDGGSFRSGYPIPAGTVANHSTASYPADRIERSVSTSNQPQHFVATVVWDWPLGKTVLAQNATERAILGGFKWSGIYQAYNGSPLALTANSCQTNPAQVTCPPITNPNFAGSARQNGKWGKGAFGSTYYYGTQTVATQPSYIVPSTGTTVSTAAGPFMNTSASAIASSYAYQFSDAPRTAPYNLYGPGNYQLDLALVRSFPLHITEAAKLDFRAEWYNVTNHTAFGVASTAVGASTFGQVTSSSTFNRKSAQFSARISF
ncbi:MAG: TonB-dependent receptor [Terracidiphilus sp.]